MTGGGAILVSAPLEGIGLGRGGESKQTQFFTLPPAAPIFATQIQLFRAKQQIVNTTAARTGTAVEAGMRSPSQASFVWSRPVLCASSRSLRSTCGFHADDRVRLLEDVWKV